MHLLIKGGKLFDPAHGLQGQVGDLCVAEGRIVPQLDRIDRVIPAQGLAVMPAGIEIRGIVAAYGRNHWRLWGVLPSAAELGRTYLRLGYTHLHEPGATLETAAYVHRELAALPGLDTSLSLTLNLRDFDRWLSAPDRLAEVAHAWRYFGSVCRALNLRVAEPFVHYQQDFYRHRCLALPRTVTILAAAARHLGARLTLEARPELLLLEPGEAPAFHLGGLGPALLAEDHFAGALKWLQAGATGDLGLLPAGPQPQCRPPLRLDVGQSAPLSWPTFAETAAGRWALKLALEPQAQAVAFSGADPVLTSPATYPALFSWLLLDSARQEAWNELVAPQSWSLGELVYRTRWLPAQYLGLADRGHLQPGARADLALYDLPRQQTPAAWRQCLSQCRYLIKGGEIVIDNYQLKTEFPAKVTWFRAEEVAPNRLVQEICQSRSFQPQALEVARFPDLPWQAVAA